MFSRQPYHFLCTTNPDMRNSSMHLAFISVMRFSCILHCSTVLMVSPYRCSSRSLAVQVGSLAWLRYTPSTACTMRLMRLVLQRHIALFLDEVFFLHHLAVHAYIVIPLPTVGVVLVAPRGLCGMSPLPANTAVLATTPSKARLSPSVRLAWLTLSSSFCGITRLILCSFFVAIMCYSLGRCKDI